VSYFFWKIGFVCGIQHDIDDTIAEAGRCNNPDDVITEFDRYDSVLL